MVALADMKRHVPSSEGFLHTLLTAAHQPRRDTPAMRQKKITSTAHQQPSTAISIPLHTSYDVHTSYGACAKLQVRLCAHAAEHWHPLPSSPGRTQQFSLEMIQHHTGVRYDQACVYTTTIVASYILDPSY